MTIVPALRGNAGSTRCVEGNQSSPTSLIYFFGFPRGDLMSNIEIAAMPIVERLQLMEVLWNSMSSETSGVLDVPLWHSDILAERLQKLDNGEENVSDWADAKKRIRNQVEGK
jgi:hypothetical protein